MKRFGLQLLIITIMAGLFSSCKKTLPVEKEQPQIMGSSLKSASTAAFFNNYFTRSNPLEWTGGDITYSVDLPNGKVLWLHGDTFLGPVFQPDASHPTRWRNPTGMLSNSINIMNNDGSYGGTLYDWDGSFPVPYVRPEQTNPNYTQEYWYKDGLYLNNKVYLFLYTMYRTGGAWGINFLRTDLATLSYPDLTVESTNICFWNNKIAYGASVLEDGPYLYIYGAEPTADNKYMHVASVWKADFPNNATYYYYEGGSSWSTSDANSSRVLADVSMEFTVFKYNGTYYLVTQEGSGLFSNKIYRYKSTSPVGPWTDKLLIYETPSHGDGTWSYDAKAHPEFIDVGGGKLLLSYDVNADNIQAVYDDADKYRPYFVWISNWQ